MKIQRLLSPKFFLIVLQCCALCKSISLPDDDRIQRNFDRHNGSYALNAKNVNGNLVTKSHGTYPRLIKYVTFSKTEETEMRKDKLVHAWQWIRATTSDMMKSVRNAFRKCFGI